MTATAPITQDMLTIPRKLPDGPQNLIGLSRDQMRDALIAAGTPETVSKVKKSETGQYLKPMLKPRKKKKKAA